MSTGTHASGHPRTIASRHDRLQGRAAALDHPIRGGRGWYLEWSDQCSSSLEIRSESLYGLTHRDVGHGGRPGDISSGPCETADQTKSDRINGAPHHDGNGCGTAPCSPTLIEKLCELRLVARGRRRMARAWQQRRRLWCDRGLNQRKFRGGGFGGEEIRALAVADFECVDPKARLKEDYSAAANFLIAYSPLRFVAIRYRRNRCTGGGTSRSPFAQRLDVRSSTPNSRAHPPCVRPRASRALAVFVGGHCGYSRATYSRERAVAAGAKPEQLWGSSIALTATDFA
jgi:hypothetical protein